MPSFRQSQAETIRGRMHPDFVAASFRGTSSWQPYPMSSDFECFADVYQRLRPDDNAQEALKQALALRPDSTASNISLPSRNSSPVYRDLRRRINRVLIEMGLPPGKE